MNFKKCLKAQNNMAKNVQLYSQSSKITTYFVIYIKSNTK